LLLKAAKRRIKVKQNLFPRQTFHASECSNCSLRDLKHCQTALCSHLEANAMRMAMVIEANWFSYWLLQSDVQLWELGCLSNVLWKNTARTQWESHTVFFLCKKSSNTSICP